MVTQPAFSLWISDLRARLADAPPDLVAPGWVDQHLDSLLVLYRHGWTAARMASLLQSREAGGEAARSMFGTLLRTAEVANVYQSLGLGATAATRH